MEGRQEVRIEKLPNLTRSCTLGTIDDAKWAADNLITRDSMPELHPDVFVKICSYPMGFRPSWSEFENPRVLYMHAVPPILDKEPQSLEDSRLWC